jgi:TPR repeat protein
MRSGQGTFTNEPQIWALPERNIGSAIFTSGGGEGVSQDSAQAATWFRKAAEQGDADAQVHLGFAYKEGWGVQQDIAEAAIWFRRAAASGDEFAQDELRKHADHYGPP